MVIFSKTIHFVISIFCNTTIYGGYEQKMFIKSIIFFDIKTIIENKIMYFCQEEITITKSVKIWILIQYKL
jgi:hypothetical protein